MAPTISVVIARNTEPMNLGGMGPRLRKGDVVRGDVQGLAPCEEAAITSRSVDVTELAGFPVCPTLKPRHPRAGEDPWHQTSGLSFARNTGPMNFGGTVSIGPRLGKG